MRKIMVRVMLVMVLVLGVVPVSSASAQLLYPTTVAPHAKNSLVVDNGVIYLIGTGLKRGFRSMEEFLSYNYRQSRIKFANDGDRALLNGPVMHARPGTLVLDALDHQTVYYIGKEGEKQWVSTVKAFNRLLKKAKKMRIIDVSDYPIGIPILK